MPFLDSYPHQPQLVVADAGYGSEENLVSLDQWSIDHLIKYGLFDKEQKKRYKQSAKNLENWTYDKESDTYTHPESWQYHFEATKHRQTVTGFEQEIRVYKADDPDSVPQKGLYINERYQHLKAKECQALLSPEGRQIFAQRKIDVEPVFR